jgi:hypothetical protein
MSGMETRAQILFPVLALIAWTFVLWFWMYATRIPAIRASGLDPGKLKRSEDLASLPTSVKQVADNYNHLHEQPTVFYALAFYSYLVGVADPLNVALAWAYVLLRVIHSLVQARGNYVPVRFTVFAAASVMLMIMTARNLLGLLVGASLP